MTSARVAPHNEQAEASLLGAMLLTATAIATAVTIVNAGDFYKPGHGTIYDAAVRLWKAGEPVDTVTVADLLRREDMLDAVGGPAALVALQSNTPATSAAGRYARIVVEDASRRRLIGICADLAERAYGGAEDVADLLDVLKADTAQIDVPLATLPDGVWSVDEYLARTEATQAPWVIPGLFRAGWRCVVVAEEGFGKSMLAQQIALCASQGIHPFTEERIPAVTTLLVDLENPDERLMDGFKMVTGPLRGPDYQPNQAWLWHREGGINIRQRADRGALEAVVAAVQPDLVCIGPIYKMYRVAAKENDEIAAGEAMAVLDDLRTRYSFGLFLEHHAPKKQGGVRDMTPYGSSLWLRWPEFGLAFKRDPRLNREDESIHFNVGRFRGDRVKAAWPDLISKNPNGLPWQARWDDSTIARHATGNTPDEEPF